MPALISILLQLYHVKKTEHRYWTPRRHQTFHTSSQTIGRLTKIASHLNLQISFIVVSRCRLAMSTFSLSCGLQHWHATMTLRPSWTTKTCTTQSMLHLLDLAVFHGKVSPFHMMVHALSGSRCGWKVNILSGSVIRVYFLRICLRIQNLLDHSTILPIKSTMTMENVATSISCQVIGLGNRL